VRLVIIYVVAVLHITYFAPGPHPRRLCLRGFTPLGFASIGCPLHNDSVFRGALTRRTKDVNAV